MPADGQPTSALFLKQDHIDHYVQTAKRNIDLQIHLRDALPCPSSTSSGVGNYSN